MSFANDFSDFLSQKKVFKTPQFIEKTFQQTKIKSETREVLVLATSDLHGEVDSLMRQPDAKKPRGLLYLSPLLQELRQQFTNTILLDAGDTLQGSPSAFLFGFHHVKDSFIIQLMNQLKYDAVVLGNHDLEIKPVQTAKAIDQSHFVWLAANLQKQGKLVLPAYHILTKQDVRIGVVGMTNPAVKMWVNPEHLEGLEFEESITSARYWLKVLRHQEKVDVAIALVHIGLGEFYDRKNAVNRGVFPPNMANHIATLGYDLVIIGHEHRTFPYRLRDQNLTFPNAILQPGKKAEGVSSALIELQSQKGRWKVTSIKRQFHRVSKVKDQKLEKMFDQELQQVKSYLMEKTFFQVKQIPQLEIFQKCGAMLAHHALKKFGQSNAFSAFSPFSKYALAKLKANRIGTTILRRDLFVWIPYDNFAILSQLYGQQITKLFFPFMRWKEGKRIQQSSVIMPSGFDLKALKPSKLYQIWISNFHFNGGGGLRSLALIHDSQKKLQTSASLRDTIFQFLLTSKQLPSSCANFLNYVKN